LIVFLIGLEAGAFEFIIPSKAGGGDSQRGLKESWYL